MDSGRSGRAAKLILRWQLQVRHLEHATTSLRLGCVDDVGDDWIRLQMISDAAMEANGGYPFKKVAWKDFQESWEIL